MTQGKSQVNPSTSTGQTLLTIHQFAQVCCTTPRTLRFYEQKGLFKPVVTEHTPNTVSTIQDKLEIS